MGQKRVSGSVSAQNRPKSQNGNTKSGRSVLKSKTDMVSARARGVKPKKKRKYGSRTEFYNFIILRFLGETSGEAQVGLRGEVRDETLGNRS